MDSKLNKVKLGILGGGQLGRMMIYSAHRLGLNVTVLDPLGKESPAGQYGVTTVTGSFSNADDIRALANECNVLTTEIEHVDAHTLCDIDGTNGKQVHPSPNTIALIQDKYKQKEFLRGIEIPVADYCLVENKMSVDTAIQNYGFPFLLKSRVMAYDGKGNAVIRSRDDVENAWNALKGDNGMLYAERFVPFSKELAVMVVKGKDEIRCYPVVETIQQDNICHQVIVPAAVHADVVESVLEMSKTAVEALEGYGIFGVELFVTNCGKVLLNEIAPRPHNSGHYTIEACETDQFENHLRAVCGMPLGSTELRVGAALMINILGDKTADLDTTYASLNRTYQVPGASVHYYGKRQVRAGRKMAHFTIVAPTVAELNLRAAMIDASLAPSFLMNATSANPQVGIIMGSDSDLPTMIKAMDILIQFKVTYEITIVSAHRTPDRMVAYAKDAEMRGIKVIIAGAGGAAHLPGMVAALTVLPVIGVPIKTSTLNGQDSLLSIVQMPRGIPVATVAIGNATNAALLAIRILGAGDSKLNAKMRSYMIEQKKQVIVKVAGYEEMGAKAYLDTAL